MLRYWFTAAQVWEGGNLKNCAQRDLLIGIRRPTLYKLGQLKKTQKFVFILSISVLFQDRYLHSYPASYGDNWTAGNIWVNLRKTSSLRIMYFKATMCMGRCGGNAFCKAKDGPEKRTVSNLEKSAWNGSPWQKIHMWIKMKLASWGKNWPKFDPK